MGTPIRWLENRAMAVPAWQKGVAIVTISLIVISYVACCIWYHSALRIVDYSDIFHNSQLRTKTTKVIVHHTAINADTTSILGIYDYHTKENGWNCVAYHYMIMNSIIYKLHNDEDRTPHAYGANDNAISVCMQADYNVRYPTLSEYWQVSSIVTRLCGRYNLSCDDVLGHGELDGNSTDCPGVHFNMDIVRFIVKLQKLLI